MKDATRLNVELSVAAPGIHYMELKELVNEEPDHIMFIIGIHYMELKARPAEDEDGTATTKQGESITWS